MQETYETWVRSLAQEDPLEECMVTHFSILAPGESCGQRSLVGYSSQGCKELDITEATQHSTSMHMKETTITDVQNIEVYLWGMITLLAYTILERKLECHLRAEETRCQILKVHPNNGMLFLFQSLFPCWTVNALYTIPSR